MTVADVTACLVTRGDVDMAPILESLIFEHVVIWNNAERSVDMKCAGRYGAAREAHTPVVYFQDDDVLVPAETQRALMVAYRPDVMVANWGHIPTVGDYADLPLVGGGAIVDSDLPWRALNRYLAQWPEDEDFYYEADYVAGILYPEFVHIRCPFNINYAVAQGASRLCNQPWQADLKARITRRARAIRDAEAVRV